MVLESSGPLSQSGPWLVIEAGAGGGVWFRFLNNKGREIICGVSMPIRVYCELPK